MRRMPIAQTIGTVGVRDAASGKLGQPRCEVRIAFEETDEIAANRGDEIVGVDGAEPGQLPDDIAQVRRVAGIAGQPSVTARVVGLGEELVGRYRLRHITEVR